MTDPYDVVIADGGLAGLCLARQLRLELPERTVAVSTETRPRASNAYGQPRVPSAKMYWDDFEEIRGETARR